MKSSKKAAKKGGQRGRAHPDSTKAQVVAALLLGAGVMEVARQMDLPHPTVSGYKAEIPAEKFDELRRKKGEILDEMVFDYMKTGLKALQAQAEIASDPAYIQKQPAGELATLHGVMADKLVRLLEATTRPGDGAGPDRQLGSGEGA